jgi:hypothetical protein
MPKNILIFSDDTGQAGGLRPDESRSNIYKLYRATRCGPDTAIDPREQLAFYDAGLGSRPPGGALFVTRAYRWLHNVASQATGLGITTNIIDCYAAIIRMWEPGDRIFLFGFSRGAYTVRSLAAVLGQCGVPTTMTDGTPLRRDVGTTTRIAREVVKKVYQHVSSLRTRTTCRSARRWQSAFASGTAATPAARPTRCRSSSGSSTRSRPSAATCSPPRWSACQPSSSSP